MGRERWEEASRRGRKREERSKLYAGGREKESDQENKERRTDCARKETESCMETKEMKVRMRNVTPQWKNGKNSIRVRYQVKVRKDEWKDRPWELQSVTNPNQLLDSDML